MTAETPTCPECGGHDALEIVPGRMRCVSEVEDASTVRSRDVAAEMVTGQPRFREDQVVTRRTCNHEYAVAAPLSRDICRGMRSGNSCGAFAVGVCVNCGSPVCSKHVKRMSGVLVCRRCEYDSVPVIAPELRTHRDKVGVDSPEAAAERARLREINEQAARYGAALARGESPFEETPDARAARLYEETTPGFPQPPKQTVGSISEIVHPSQGEMSGPTLEELCLALERLVPGHRRRFLLKPRTGLFSPAVYELGWGFQFRNAIPANADYSFSTHNLDNVSNYLLTSDGRLWKSLRRVQTSSSVDGSDLSGIDERWSPKDVRISWTLVESFRRQVIAWRSERA